MARIIVILLGCAVLIGVVTAAARDRTAPASPYLVCAEQRVMTFGSGHKSKSIAELAAIARWMEQSERIGPAFANWSLARDRWLSCRRILNTDYLQCKVAGLPCRPKPG